MLFFYTVWECCSCCPFICHYSVKLLKTAVLLMLYLTVVLFSVIWSIPSVWRREDSVPAALRTSSSPAGESSLCPSSVSFIRERNLSRSLFSSGEVHGVGILTDDSIKKTLELMFLFVCLIFKKKKNLLH